MQCVTFSSGLKNSSVFSPLPLSIPRLLGACGPYCHSAGCRGAAPRKNGWLSTTPAAQKVSLSCCGQSGHAHVNVSCDSAIPSSTDTLTHDSQCLMPKKGVSSPLNTPARASGARRAPNRRAHRWHSGWRRGKTQPRSGRKPRKRPCPRASSLHGLPLAVGGQRRWSGATFSRPLQKMRK